MDIARLCRRDAVTVNETDGLVAAAQSMRDRHVGFLVVVAPGPVAGSVLPVGVLTDRDIVVKVTALEADAGALTVGDVMTRRPVLAAEGDSMESTLVSMRRAGVRRLPVVGARGRLVGVVSLDDILESLANEFSSVAASIRNGLRMENVRRM